MRRCLLLVGLCAAFAGSVSAQYNTAALAARQWRQQHERAIIDEFFSLLSLPNIARDKADIQSNADMIKGMMEKRGIPAKAGIRPRLESGCLRGDQDARRDANHRLLCPLRWTASRSQRMGDASLSTGAAQRDDRKRRHGDSAACARHPFNPEWRIYARSSGDDKAPIIAILAALDAIRAAGLNMKSNIKFAFEGEEEAGRRTSRRFSPPTRSCFQATSG